MRISRIPIALAWMIGAALSIAKAQAPALFEPNRGQAAPEVAFVARTADGTALLAGGSTVLLHGDRMQRMEFLGASADCRVEPGTALPGRSHYFRGQDPARWVTNVPQHAGVRFVGLYPGVDLAWRSAGGYLEYDIELQAGADLREVAFRVEGVDEVRLDDAGNLRLRSGEHEVVHRRPVCWQVEPDGTRRNLECRFLVVGDTLRFEAPDRDPALPLVVDPVLVFSTYLGGSMADWVGGLAADTTGNAVVAGYTSSTDFPIAGGFQSLLSGSRDAFVTKLSADGSTVLWSTFLGGSLDDTCGGPHGLALDSNDRPCLTGNTQSPDFPTTAGCAQPLWGGNMDAFVAVLAADGSSLVYSTYLGGPNWDGPRGISVDAQDRLAITGTARVGFPTTPGAFSTTVVGDNEAFATLLTPAGGGAADLLYSTYLGGGLADRGEDVAVDALGRIHVCATIYTQKSAALPRTTPSAFRPTLTFASKDTSGKWAGYYAVLVPAGNGASDLAYATFVNSRQSYALTAYALELDGLGRAFIAGLADGATIPTTSGAYDATANGLYDLYLVVADPARTGSASLVYGSYIGSSHSEMIGDLALDAGGRAYLVGYTNCNIVPPGNKGNIPYPTTVDAIRRYTAGSWDCALTALDITLAPSQGLVYSTLIGGPSEDHASNVALGPNGRCFVGGIVAPGSLGFPTTPGAFDTTYNGDADGILLRFDF